MSAYLELRDVDVAYGGKPVVTDVSFDLREGAIGCLLGPSGCGKTSLLRAIAGFEPVARGRIRLRRRTVAETKGMVAPEARNVGMVFQDLALFPHLTVADNVGFGLRGVSVSARNSRIGQLLDIVGLKDSGGVFPHQLSGGQQQRVALARAMAPRPDILLLDEPFSNIDAEFREQLAAEIRTILRRDKTTAMLVTHDQHEAFALADVIGVLGDGRLRQWADAYSLYHRPTDPFVADFIGRGAMIEGVVAADGSLQTELGTIRVRSKLRYEAGARVDLLLRPDDVVYDEAGPLRLEVAAKVFRGAQYLYSLRTEKNAEILCLTASHHDLPVGASMGVRLDLAHVTVFPKSPDDEARP